MLHRRLATRIGGITVGEGGQQRSHNGHDPAVVIEVLAGFPDEEISRLGVDVVHCIIFFLGGLDNRFAQDFSGGVDGEVDATEAFFGFLE